MTVGIIAAHYVSASSTYSAEVLADSPLGYWRQDDVSGTTMTDSSGNARHGTYTNSPTLGQAGALTSSSTAILYDGSTQRGGVTPAASWMNVTAAVSLEAWIKTTGSGTILSRTATQTPYRIGVLSTTGCAFIEIRTLASSTIGGFIPVNDGNWHHIVGTWASGGEGRIYVDGVLDVFTNKSGSLISTTGGISVAARNADSFFPGTLDEVAFYGTELTGTRIAAHYAAR